MRITLAAAAPAVSRLGTALKFLSFLGKKVNAAGKVWTALSVFGHRCAIFAARASTRQL